jgi:hypothetical protein
MTIHHGILEQFISTSPVAFYPFEDNCNDDIGSYDLSIDFTSVDYSTGIVGKSLSLNPTNALVNNNELTADVFSGTKSWSISFWNKLSSSLRDAEFLISVGSNNFDITLREYDPSVGHGAFLRCRRMRLEWLLVDQLHIQENSLLTGWHHIVVTYKNPIHKIYIDNNYRGSLNSNLSISSELINHFIIGAEVHFPFKEWPFIGEVDQLRIYNDEISASEVNYLWNNGNGI